MSTQLCTIKGSRDGLVVTITDASRFDRCFDALERQLIASESFFQGSSAKLLVKQGTLTSSQIDEIEGLLAQHGMRLDRRTQPWHLPQGRGPVPESEPVRLEDSTLSSATHDPVWPEAALRWERSGYGRCESRRRDRVHVGYLSVGRSAGGGTRWCGRARQMPSSSPFVWNPRSCVLPI